jgi:hypothetical protein
VGAFFCYLAPSIGSPLRLERQLDANQVAINNRCEIIADGCYTAGLKASLCYAFLASALHSPETGLMGFIRTGLPLNAGPSIIPRPAADPVAQGCACISTICYWVG